MQHDPIHTAAQVLMHLAHEGRGGEAIRLAVLGHQVTDVDLLRLRLADGLGDAIYEQVRHDTRIEITRADDDRVGAPDRANGLRAGPGGRLCEQAANGGERLRVMLSARVDISLAADDLAV